MATMLDQRPTSTDVMSDPNYLRALLRSSNPHDRQVAETQLALLEKNQLQANHQQMFEETRAQRRDIHDENLAQRRDYQSALASDREARQSALNESASTRRAAQLQMMAADPNLDKNTREAAKAAMVKDLKLDVQAPATATAGKGEYGPGGAPKPAVPPASATTYIPPTAAFAPTSIPEAPHPNPPSFHPERYGHDLSGAQLAYAKKNLDKADAQDAQINQLLYKRDIGGANFAKIYGTDDPAALKPGAPPAADIPDIYGGKPTIPQGAGVGYYDRGGKFLGPAYDEHGTKLAVPQHTAGMVGTASLGASYDQAGNITHVPEGAKGIITGKQPPTPSAVANPPTNEASTPAPAPAFQTPTESFLMQHAEAAATPPQPQSGRGEFTGSYPLQPNTGSKLLDFPAATPSYINPAAVAKQPPAPPMINPQASNERQDLLREIDNSIYGGGQAPSPTPKPTPIPPQRLAEKKRNPYAFA